jgi:putative hemolysin
MHPSTRPRLFALDALEGKVPALVRSPIESLLGISEANATYEAVTSEGTPTDFCRAVLDHLGVTVRVAREDLAKVPARGPLVVVANHPFGGIEGLALASILLSVRPDVKVMANRLLARIPEMHGVSIFVDPLGSGWGRSVSVRGLKESIRWLRDGGALGVFPAGTVAHLHVKQRRITDPPWSAHVAALIRRTGAQVLPVFFDGANGKVFQVAGLIHPSLRTALLPREFFNKRNHAVTAHIGSALPAERLADYDDERSARHLRLRAYALQGRTPYGQPAEGHARRSTRRLPIWPKRPAPRPVADPLPADRLERDIDRLPPDALLAESGDMVVYQADACQIRSVLLELGRLREIAFRAEGEGTGKPRDLDPFDQTYTHLLIWHRAARELVGAYRVGPTDQTLAAHGPAGLYVSELFEIDRRFFAHLGPSLELGRSFVRPEYQKSFTPLMLLWTGIGHYLTRQGRYRYMFGPVSISNRYTPLSKALMAAFLSRAEHRSPAARWVRPRTPFKPAKSLPADVLDLAGELRDVAELNRLIADIEPDGKGIPILLKQYLKLSSRTLGFNIDPSFGYCLDCLIVFDPLAAQRRTLGRYMGKEQATCFLAAHGAEGEGDETSARGKKAVTCE